jgi:serine/threonine protein kinase
MATIHQQHDQSSGSGIFQKLPKLSGFTILEHLHEGSTCAIYRARQDRLGRVVTLKMMPEWPPPTDLALERFNRAAYVSAQAPHPNLLTLYDTGAKDGFYYASIEFVAGQTLQKQLSQLPLSNERMAVQVGLHVARALSALHAKDICHRNVKPKNIFIETSGNTRLIGLGLASCKSAFFSPHLDSHAIGTPHFMAPEMIRGCCADPRSDLYSLGVTLFLMTAGRPPFDSGIPAAVMTRHLTEAPLSLAKLRPDLSDDFVSLVHMLIAREPDQRLQTAREVVSVLEPLLKRCDSGKSMPIPPPLIAASGTPGKKFSSIRRALAHPIAISVVSALATVLTLLALYKTVPMLLKNAPPAPHPVPETSAPQEQAPAAAKPATETTAPARAETAVLELQRLLERNTDFRDAPADGKKAWDLFLNTFPDAEPRETRIARERQKHFTDLEAQERVRRQPEPPAQPVPDRQPALELEF